MGGTKPIRTYRSATLIYNPLARGLDEKRRTSFDRAVARLHEAGHRVFQVATRGPGTAADIARESVRQGADLILVAGGDGTINEALNGMVPCTVPLGVLPGGTANVLATEIGLGGNMEKAARRLGEWVPRRVSAGLLRCDGADVSRYFLQLAGIGFDAHIVNNVHPRLKKQHGKLSYWLAGFHELGRTLEEFDVYIDERRYRCSFALASRVRNYGGTVAITRHASLTSQDFAVVLFRDSNSFRYLKYLVGVLTRRLNRMEGVSILRAESIEFDAPADPPVFVHIDGEVAGRLPASVEIVPDALTLLVPPEFTG